VLVVACRFECSYIAIECRSFNASFLVVTGSVFCFLASRMSCSEYSSSAYFLRLQHDLRINQCSTRSTVFTLEE
jgi:hypothetical protein